MSSQKKLYGRAASQQGTRVRPVHPPSRTPPATGGAPPPYTSGARTVGGGGLPFSYSAAARGVAAQVQAASGMGGATGSSLVGESVTDNAGASPQGASPAGSERGGEGAWEAASRLEVRQHSNL